MEVRKVIKKEIEQLKENLYQVRAWCSEALDQLDKSLKRIERERFKDENQKEAAEELHS